MPQSPQTYLRYRIVGGTRCLQPLHAGYANAHVGLLDHCYIVGTVADGQRDRLRVGSDQIYHVGLLNGWHSAADNRLAGDTQVQEISPQITAQCIFQRFAVDYQCDIVLLPQLIAELGYVPLDTVSRILRRKCVRDDKNSAKTILYSHLNYLRLK